MIFAQLTLEAIGLGAASVVSVVAVLLTVLKWTWRIAERVTVLTETQGQVSEVLSGQQRALETLEKTMQQHGEQLAEGAAERRELQRRTGVVD